MKIGKRAEGRTRTTKSEKNNSKKTLLLVLVMVVTVLLIVWVYSMGQKAEETVSVVMLADSVYKNEVITEAHIKEYRMLTGEFEKYATVDKNGNKTRRIVLWEERGKLLNTFAAYPLQTDTVAMINNFVKSRTDNSDTVMYSYPGKNIIKLSVGETDLRAFKTFLQPGDRVNITAIFSTKERVYTVDEEGERRQQTVDVFREESVFTDIMVADLLNSQGQSILDLYASYNEKTVYQQAALDASESWLKSVEPATLLVALTPEEETRYYKYLSKADVEFHMSLPQRMN